MPRRSSEASRNPADVHAKKDVLTSRATPPNGVGVTLAKPARLIVSLLLVIHLIAMVAEPIRFFTRSREGRPSPAVQPIRQLLAPYVEFAYLSHGYFFFAPNPGPSHLMECRIASNGQDDRRIRLPDHRLQRPRLLYHRHFMLAEFLNNLFAPEIPLGDIEQDNEISRELKKSRALYVTVRGSMERHLSTKYQAETANIRRVEHRLPSDVEVFSQRWRLDDERLYILLPESAVADLLPAQSPATSIPAFADPRPQNQIGAERVSRRQEELRQ